MTRLERLLSAVADRPEGEKVNIAAIVREFTPTQAQIIAGIERLIEIGHLDRATLRCAVKLPHMTNWGGRDDDVPAVVIIAEIEPFLARSGLSKSRFGRECLNDPKFMARLDREALVVRAATALKIRRFISNYETPAEVSKETGPTEPPAPVAAADGGGDARCGAPPPDSDPELPDGPVAEGAEGFPLLPRPPVETAVDLDRLLTCFGNEFEQLSAVAQRYGGISVFRIVTFARRLRLQGLVEFDPPGRTRAYSLWRRAQQNTKEAPGTARKASGAASSGVATRIEDHASTVEPASTVAPSARARPAAPKVDLKVNARRDPTQPPDTPLTDYAEHERITAARLAQSYKRRVRTRAQNLLDAGEEAGARGRNVEVRGAMKELRENAEAQARLDDPVEQAKTVIRIAGWNCFAAVIKGGPADHYYVGNRIHTEAEMLAFAERLRTSRRLRA